MLDFTIWRRNHSGGPWSLTSHSVKARTEKEAQSKTRRSFQGAGFSSMSLVAVPVGKTPNGGNAHEQD